jgi:hypothetical protein
MNIVSTVTDHVRHPPPKQLETRALRALIAWLRQQSTMLGYLLAILITYIGWIGRTERNITAEEGLGYILGIVGASLMAALLLYPLRKRVRFLRFLGTTKRWFFWHMVLGIIGPILILFHSNFALGSLNSRISLYCMLLVSGSGLIGRYLYSHIHNGLYGRKTTLRSLTKKMMASAEQVEKSGELATEINEALTILDHQVLEAPHNLFDGMTRPLVISIKTRVAYIRLNWILKKKLIARSIESKSITEHQKRLEQLTKRNLRNHLMEQRNIANLYLFERLFSFWHILHLPFFLMLCISTIVHILAVHMY